ncbi:MAG: hypothetical protein ABEK04_03555 [Candidatus Nanohalobium sp.]
MGYLSSAIGKPMKWLGGAAAVYGSYKLATENGGEIATSLGDAAEGLSDGGNEFDAVYDFLNSTQEQVRADPEYGSNMKTAGKGLAAGLIGAYLDGSLSADNLPERYLEDPA